MPNLRVVRLALQEYKSRGLRPNDYEGYESVRRRETLKSNQDDDIGELRLTRDNIQNLMKNYFVKKMAKKPAPKPSDAEDPRAQSSEKMIPERKNSNKLEEMVQDYNPRSLPGINQVTKKPK